jgi:hypothetical protein
MLVQWFDVPEEEKPAEKDGREAANSDSSAKIQLESLDPYLECSGGDAIARQSAAISPDV